MKWRKFIIETVALTASVAAISCRKDLRADSACVGIVLDCGMTLTKSSSADEDAVWDVNLFVTGENGLAEEHIWKSWGTAQKGCISLECNLLKNRDYTITAFANAGYDMGEMNGKDLEEMKFHMTRPDGFSHGMPMCGRWLVRISGDGNPVEIRMERLMSKVTVQLDRSRLDKNVNFKISGIRVGNCPKWARALPPSRISSAQDVFQSGYYAEGGEKTDIYLLENMQGGLNRELCSYIELEIDYESDLYYSEGRGLIYRFYLREGNSYLVQRNCHYTVSVCPEKDGLLCEDSWRVDKSGLVSRKGEPYLQIMPSGTVVDGVFYEHYYEMDTRSKRHFDLACFPGNMKIWFREDLLYDEKEEGRAIYTMDEDGKGFTIETLDEGCTSIMEIMAGEPLNDSETIVVYVR